jgi:cytoskeletal protein CcmA (bactofilin family)
MSRSSDERRAPDPTQDGGPEPDHGQLGPGLAIEGVVRGRGDLRIEGALRGSVDLDGSLVIGPQAQVTAPLRARRVEVLGEVVGTIEADHVAVKAGGWVAGDVRAGTLAIDDGATLEGLIDMDFEPEPRRAAGPRRTR